MKLDLEKLKRTAQAHRQAMLGASGPVPESVVFATATIALIARIRELEAVALSALQSLELHRDVIPADELPLFERGLDDSIAVLRKGAVLP